jgi:hypothetical protein
MNRTRQRQNPSLLWQTEAAHCELHLLQAIDSWGSMGKQLAPDTSLPLASCITHGQATNASNICYFTPNSLLPLALDQPPHTFCHTLWLGTRPCRGERQVREGQVSDSAQLHPWVVLAGRGGLLPLGHGLCPPLRPAGKGGQGACCPPASLLGPQTRCSGMLHAMRDCVSLFQPVARCTCSRSSQVQGLLFSHG